MELEVDMPPAIGGGSFVMRELTAGEFEDSLKRSTRGVKADEALSAGLDMQGDQVCDALVAWHGKPLPRGDATLKEQFWRGLTTRQRAFLIGVFDKLHTVPEQEIADFFEAAVAARAAKKAPKKPKE